MDEHHTLSFFQSARSLTMGNKRNKNTKRCHMLWRTVDFPQLQTKHELTNPYFFRFIQLRHAFQTQFKEKTVESLPSDLETLLTVEDLTKTLSVTYKEFFKKTSQALSRCRERWALEVPGIQGEDWYDLWMQPFKHLVSARDRLVQFKFLHRSYYSLARIAKIFHTASAERWRCSHSPANGDHIFWLCPHIQQYWSEITSCISDLLVVPIPMTVRVCLLGLVDEVVPSRALRTLLNILLTYGRKAILLNWKKPRAPSLASWKGLVNSMMSHYKATYIARGCGKKFDKVWQAWYKSVNQRIL